MNYHLGSLASSFVCKLYLRIASLFGKKIKLDVGSANLKIKGWITSDLPAPYAPRPFYWIYNNKKLLLDATSFENWKLYFDKETIFCVNTEHVLEHLNNKEIDLVLQNIYYFLKPNGNLRIAVPDGGRDDPYYMSKVKPPVDGHKQLFTLQKLTATLTKNGFEVVPKEFFENGKLIKHEYDDKFGKIKRSSKYDKREIFKYNDHCYTSLIVDAYKTKNKQSI